MRIDNIVILKGQKELKFETDVLKPNTLYRSIQLSEGAVTQILVYGIVFDKETFDASFKYASVRDKNKFNFIKINYVKN